LSAIHRLVAPTALTLTSSRGMWLIRASTKATRCQLPALRAQPLLAFHLFSPPLPISNPGSASDTQHLQEMRQTSESYEMHDGSDGNGELEDLSLPIQTGVRQRGTRQTSSRRVGAGALSQQKHIIGGDVVRSMKRGLTSRQKETRTRVLCGSRSAALGCTELI
jgi:hypothetical protein